MSKDELRQLGLRSYGSNVQIHRNANIVFPQNIDIGDHVRIDGFVVVVASKSICFKSYIHIGSFSYLSAVDELIIDDFANISQGVRIYTSSDDYSGESLTSPLVPNEFKNVHIAPTSIGRHVIIGSNSVVLPGVIVGEGCAIGALSFVKESLAEWGIYAGCPARLIRPRSRQLLRLEHQFFQDGPMDVR